MEQISLKNLQVKTESLGVSSLQRQPLASYLPTTHLAELLTSARGNAGFSLEEMTDRFDGRFSVFDLMQLEAAMLRTTDDDLRAIAKAYGLDYSLFAPTRGLLRLDLAKSTISIGAYESTFGAGASSTDVLLRYLALLYNMRAIKPGESLVLRNPDLNVLAETFGSTVLQVEHALVHLMTNNASEIRTCVKALTRRSSFLQRLRG